MSGLEVAGVVLGAIPLVISALEHYGEGLAVMKNMRDFECVFDDIQIQFAASVGIYMDSCYQLLSPLNLPDKQMNELLEQRNKEAWLNPALRTAVEGRLGPNFKIYLALMEKLNKRIMLFGRKLKLTDKLTPPWIESDGTVDEKARKKFFKSSWTRIRGGFDSEKYATLLQEIDRDIDKISKLTSGAAKLEPLRAEKKNRLQSMYWQTVRDSAQRLFDSLSSRLHPCACNHAHQANLRLDIRKARGDDDPDRFAFLLNFEKAHCSPIDLPWTWRGVEIESLQCSAVQSTNIIAPPRKARFAPDVSIIPVAPPDLTSVPSLLAAKIDNLCAALIKQCQSGYCLGVLEDQSWQHHIYAATGPGSDNLISVKDTIGRSHAIATRQKCTLALTLASSVLQLHDTPWLPRDFDTKDIFMLKTRTGVAMSSQIYVSQKFNSPAAVKAANKRRRCVKNEMVFALGVALLELTHGCPILALKETEDLNEFGQEDSMTVVSIASRLADDINNLESENYAKAVLRCIRCNFDTFTYDLADREFIERFYEGVVIPLQLDYEYATGTKI